MFPALGMIALAVGLSTSPLPHNGNTGGPTGSSLPIGQPGSGSGGSANGTPPTTIPPGSRLDSQRQSAVPGRFVWVNALAGAKPVKGAKFVVDSLRIKTDNGWSTFGATSAGHWQIFGTNIRFIADDDFSGRAAVVFRARDTQGKFATATASISVG